jgi:hypothetical protein
MASFEEGREMNQSKFRSSLHFEFGLSSCTGSFAKPLYHNLYDWKSNLQGEEKKDAIKSEKDITSIFMLHISSKDFVSISIFA